MHLKTSVYSQCTEMCTSLYWKFTAVEFGTAVRYEIVGGKGVILTTSLFYTFSGNHMPLYWHRNTHTLSVIKIIMQVIWL